MAMVNSNIRLLVNTKCRKKCCLTHDFRVESVELHVHPLLPGLFCRGRGGRDGLLAGRLALEVVPVRVLLALPVVGVRAVLAVGEAVAGVVVVAVVGVGVSIVVLVIAVIVVGDPLEEALDEVVGRLGAAAVAAAVGRVGVLHAAGGRRGWRFQYHIVVSLQI